MTLTKAAKSAPVYTCRLAMTAVVFGLLTNDAGGLASTSTGAATQPPGGADTFSAQVETCLGIADSGADVLPMIADAIAKQQGSASTAAEALGKLVNSLLEGPHPTAYVDTVLSLLEVGPDARSPFARPGWKYGTSAQWDVLGESLWNLAVAAKVRDPKKASELARASMMLAAMNDVLFGWSNLASHVYNDPDVAKGLLALSDVQFEQLRKVISIRVDQMGIASAETLKAYDGIDAITARAGAPDTAEVKAILEHADRAFRDGLRQLASQYDIIATIWSFSNLLKIRKDEAGLVLVRRQLEAWKRNFPDPNITRWVEQALSRDGPPPKQLVVRARGGITRVPARGRASGAQTRPAASQPRQ